MMYQYFVKIVPTIYVKTDGEVSPTFHQILILDCYFMDELYIFFSPVYHKA